MNEEATTEIGNDCGGFADLPVIVEDLLCQVEHLRAIGGDPAVIDDLLAQVAQLQAR